VGGAEYAVDAVLVGEIHGVAAHGDEAYAIIDDVNPEYVALEADQDTDLDENLTRFYHFQTLDRINQVCKTATGDPYVQDTEALQTAIYTRWQDGTAEQTGVVPETVDELLHTRIPEFDNDVRSMINDYADIREQQEETAVYDDISDVIDRWDSRSMIGRRAQARFVDNVFEDVQLGRFQPVPWDSRDLHPDKSQFSFPPSDADRATMAQSYRQREEFGAEKVAEYVEQTDRPVVVLMGKNHLADDAVFTDELDGYDVTYDTHILETSRAEDVERLVSDGERSVTADD
jgi:hypothetical protein